MEADRPHPVPGEGRPDPKALMHRAEEVLTEHFDVHRDLDGLILPLTSEQKAQQVLATLSAAGLYPLPAVLLDAASELASSRDERRQMEEALEAAVGMLESISAIYTAFLDGDTSASDGWSEVERVLRGPPPEGYPIILELRAALRSPSSTPEAEEAGGDA